jgi:glutamyl-tRNA(Gln) amidotransferase subunit D
MAIERYSKAIQDALESLDICIGDRIKVEKEDVSYEGILLPRPEFGNNNCLVIKLESGYNIGVYFENCKISKIGPGIKLEKFPIHKYDERKEIPDISLIATGGTIASRVDYRTGGVYTCMHPGEIFASIPELAGVINFKAIRTPFNLSSEDMLPKQWQIMAKLIEKELNSGLRGVICTHGTDTLHYSSAMISFMLNPVYKPIVFVGAQRSPDRGSFDGAMNLICASYIAGHSDIAEVCVVMHAEVHDSYCFACPGVKVRKMHTSRRDAFRPINDLPIAKIFPNGKIEIMRKYRKRDDSQNIVANTNIEEKVAFIISYPGADPEIIDFYVDRNYKGIVVSATGLGHVPTATPEKSKSWVPAIKRAIEEGVTIVFAPQCIYGRLNPFVYSNAREMYKLGVIYCGDILPEVAYVKLMWLLGQTSLPTEIKAMMEKNLVGELNNRHTLDMYLF